MINTIEASNMLSALSAESYGNALSYIRFLFERDRASASTNEEAMMRIQSLIGDNRGWASEEEMLEDMAEFRRRRSA